MDGDEKERTMKGKSGCGGKNRWGRGGWVCGRKEENLM